MPATIKDVARYAGCSIKTVSRVMNDEPYVTAELRTRVQVAIRAVGYAPNISARRLVQNKSFMICILIYPRFFQPALAILSRIMDVSNDDEYDILVKSYFPSIKRSRDRLVQLITERRIDGFVSTPPCDSDDFVADLLTTYKVPLVQINPFKRSETIPYVAGDDFQGARLITEHLISLGHHRIAYLFGPRNMRSSSDRLYGYRAALEAHQIAQSPDLLENSEYTFDGGYAAAILLLKRPHPPTAIFAGSDEAAFGVIYAVQEMGLHIPADISVCGYDDFTLSKNIWPGLTTMHQPAEELVESAARLLIKILKGEDVENNQIILPSRLVVRGSSGPVPR